LRRPDARVRRLRSAHARAHLFELARDEDAEEQCHEDDEDAAAEELGEIGRHRGDLAHHPHHPHHRTRKPVAAHLCEIPPGDDAELGGQRLEQHGDEIGGEHHP
jgi:hypothetical protein